MLMLLAVLLGAWSLDRLNTQFFPEFGIDVITVSIGWPGASPADVDANITTAVIPEVRYLDGVKRVTSYAVEGSGTVVVEFEPGTDMQRALSEAESAIARILTFPEEIEEPDRTWMALAAYNIGLGHLYDAQKIAEMRGGDPYAWADVREALPLLQKRKWYSQVRYGYARGGEPVIYVRNIRRYYEILNYIERSQQQFFQLNQREPGADDGGLFDVVPPVL